MGRDPPEAAADAILAALSTAKRASDADIAAAEKVAAAEAEVHRLTMAAHEHRVTDAKRAQWAGQIVRSNAKVARFTAGAFDGDGNDQD